MSGDDAEPEREWDTIREGRTVTERLYVVQWSHDGHSWWLCSDEYDDADGVKRKHPAAFVAQDDAEHWLDDLLDALDDGTASYRIVIYEPAEAAPVSLSWVARGGKAHAAHSGRLEQP